MAASSSVRSPTSVRIFAAALPGVGVMDMLRRPHRFTGGTLWIADFGSPDESSIQELWAIRPITTSARRDYPAILATTAESDDRVVPGHTFKYAAALQAADLGPRPRLVRVETRAGHGRHVARQDHLALRGHAGLRRALDRSQRCPSAVGRPGSVNCKSVRTRRVSISQPLAVRTTS